MLYYLDCPFAEISDIVTSFVSDFRDSARSMTDLDIWLAVLLLLSSFVPTCNIMWFGLNSRMVGLTWSYIQLTLAPLNDLTLISFLFAVFSLRHSHLHFWQYYPQVWTLYFLCYWRVLSDCLECLDTNILSQKMSEYNHGRVQSMVFEVAKAQYDWISYNFAWRRKWVYRSN